MPHCSAWATAVKLAQLVPAVGNALLMVQVPAGSAGFTVTRTGTAGGTYSAVPAGLSINATTGDVNVAASTAGTYTVTYTIAAAGGCGIVTATTSITINSLSVAPTGATASSAPYNMASNSGGGPSS